MLVGQRSRCQSIAVDPLPILAHHWHATVLTLQCHKPGEWLLFDVDPGKMFGANLTEAERATFYGACRAAFDRQEGKNSN
jgi:hypothetical protein